MAFNTIKPVIQKPKILIIEGSKNHIGMIINSIIQTHTNRYTIRAATSGEEGMSILSQFDPNLIIVDIFMKSKMDGFQFIRHLKKNNFGCKIIAMIDCQDRLSSAKKHIDSYLRLAKSLGADVAIAKEIMAKTLPPEVHDLLSNLQISEIPTYGVTSENHLSNN